MQAVGFMMDFIFFVVPAFRYKYYTSPAHVHAFQAMYFLSSFFNQFGPNSVTFLVAAEVYPTPVRATAHGFSAAVGKLGALTAAVLYNYIDTPTKFYVVPWFGLIGLVLSTVFLPDTTGLDLKEPERRWQCIREGREHDYHGIAIHPRHISLWEYWRGVSKDYNPDLDYKQKIEEMRVEWEKNERVKYAEKEGQHHDDNPYDDHAFNDDVSTYFARSMRKNTLKEKIDHDLDRTH